jgi:hypothetical protein
MRRFRIPEIALGALLTVAVFAVGSTVQLFRPTRDAHDQAASTAQHSFSEAETNERIANYNEWLAWFTGFLAVSTAGLWWVTWRSGLRQASDMRATIAAALASNEISRSHLIADQRAWLTVRLDITSDFVINDRGCAFEVSAKITNIGKTPALNAHSAMTLTLNHADAADVLAKFSAQNRDKTPQWSRSVLPTECYNRPWKLHASKGELDQFSASGKVLPLVVGCVTYQILPDRTVHQTRFLYHVVVEGGPLGELIPAQPAVIGKALLQCRVHAGGDAD